MRLRVYFMDKLTGEIEQTERGAMQFRYADSWLSDPESFGAHPRNNDSPVRRGCDVSANPRDALEKSWSHDKTAAPMMIPIVNLD